LSAYETADGMGEDWNVYIFSQFRVYAALKVGSFLYANKEMNKKTTYYVIMDFTLFITHLPA
jgi:hypothetical protein